MDMPVPLETSVSMSYPKGELQGVVRYCVYREIGYFIGLKFDGDNKWNQRAFRPQHLLDPRRLVLRSASRANKPDQPTTIQ